MDRRADGRRTDGRLGRTAGHDDEERDLASALRDGDDLAFARIVRHHERGLQAHCRRMLGSRVEAEDAVQETFLRAWRHRRRLESRSSCRAWLYRIATNTCLDALRRPTRRRVRPVADTEDTSEVGAGLSPWPAAAGREAEPDVVAVARETVELAFLAAIRHLPARQRAVLVMCDALGWPAADTAELLGISVAAATSALQRARATVRARVGARDDAPMQATRDQRALLGDLMDAHGRADGGALAALAITQGGYGPHY